MLYLSAFTYTHLTYKNTLTCLLVGIEAWIFTKHTNKEFLGQNFSIFLVKIQTFSSYRHTHKDTVLVVVPSDVSLSPNDLPFFTLFVALVHSPATGGVLKLKLMQKYDCESFFGKIILLAYVLKMIE